MNLDKISEDRLFLNNTKEEIVRWSQNLHYFHYMRARGGHNCEGDAFCAYFRFTTQDDLIEKLSQIEVHINRLGEGDIAFDPFESYSIEDLDKLKIVVAGFNDLIQPQNVEVFGYKTHVWVNANTFEISVSGTKNGQVYKVSEEDFEVCSAMEKEFSRLGWNTILDHDIKSQIHCISKEKYPELFES